mmetsp:Transcript_49820/g.89118  ORF Transcript_49820/g.89118 Transcript_49820/m.89118 type:complete len:258 (+) Transcript_49820:1034-1807(+)
MGPQSGDGLAVITENPDPYTKALELGGLMMGRVEINQTASRQRGAPQGHSAPHSGQKLRVEPRDPVGVEVNVEGHGQRCSMAELCAGVPRNPIHRQYLVRASAFMAVYTSITCCSLCTHTGPTRTELYFPPDEGLPWTLSEVTWSGPRMAVTALTMSCMYSSPPSPIATNSRLSGYSIITSLTSLHGSGVGSPAVAIIMYVSSAVRRSKNARTSPVASSRSPTVMLNIPVAVLREMPVSWDVAEARDGRREACCTDL